jgi:D-3-phosphoglycerate dehydrogenase / 2-oxoglutarate reductase
MSKKVLLLENIHASAKEMFEQAGFEVHSETTSFSESELLQKIPSYDVIGIRSKTNLTSKVLKNATQLQVIGCYCIGTNQVDLETSALEGIPVFNAPHSNTRSVAELVIAEIISLSRNLCDLSYQVHTGAWNKSAKGAREVRGKTLGIIGYGHIGSQVSVLAESMGLDVCFYDVVKKLPLGNAKAMPTLESLLERSDFITLHVPETPETKNLITAKEFSQMKKGVHIINASRGTVVVIEDLVAALKNKKVAGAAVDVFPQEPKDNNERFLSQLQGLPNVILTPHIGGSTEEAQAAIGSEVTYSLLSFMQQGKTYGAVQFPSMEVPMLRPGVSRLINAHKNVPGVLGEVNSIVSKFGVNIQAQYLATNNQVGYLVMDLEDPKLSVTVAQKIGELKTSLKTRLI